MKDILDSIENNLTNKNYYSALFMSLMIPSICGALESEDGKDSQTKYENWFNSNMPHLQINGSDCYRLRCSLLHQAYSSHPNSSFSRVIFTYPVTS